MQVIIPINGDTVLNDDGFTYPKPLIEINGSTIVEQTINYYAKIKDVHLYFLIKKEDEDNFKFSQTLKQACNGIKCTIKIIERATAGSVATCLLASDLVDFSKETIIASYDQRLNIDIELFISDFRERTADFGVITFESVHPKWSYVEIKDKRVVRAAEKNAISKNAIAGFYYFARFEHFFDAAVEHMNSHPINNTHYFVSETLNQLVINSLYGVAYHIHRDEYLNYYDANQIKSAQNQGQRLV